VKTWLALAASAATAALLVSVAPAAPTAPPNAADLEAEIVCPVCKTTLDQSNAEIARRMKALIRERIADGATEQEIKAELVDQFGPAVLAEPPKRGFDLLAWALPIGGAALGAVAVGALAWSWSRRRRDERPAGELEVDPELERRVDQALQELDE
jgi:cytochrome c-type biogenesis protein CcmH